jgi:peptide/nickel transport system substrate-binding protein
MRSTRIVATSLAVALSAVVLAACGGGGGGGGSTNAGGGSGGGASGTAPDGTANIAPAEGKKGGTINVLSATTFDHMDPGQSYYQLDYAVVFAVHRPLYSFKPNSTTETPDLADGPPEISSDLKTVTVKIKPGIKYSPGTVDRAVESKDVKYAIERTFLPGVANGYAGSYFGAIQGIDAAKDGKDVSGIETPDAQTIVFKLTKPFGATLARALVLPASAPVPEEYAKRFDSHNPTTYDSDPTKQAFTGPYVISSYSTTRGVTLKRNTNWDPKTDFRPAYADAIDWKIGNDSNVAGRQTLDGTGVLMADTPPAPVVKTAYQTKKAQIAFIPAGNHYSAMNTKIPPFDNLNIRKAVLAATDRNAIILTRGGRLTGEPGTGFLPPAAPGFKESGGAAGFGFDFLKNPNGDIALAKEYMKKAGYPSGMYTGDAHVLMVGETVDPGPKTMAVQQRALEQLGFKVDVRPVPQATMYSKFCGVPKAKVNMCPTVGWLPDFPDGYAYLWVPFNGSSISTINNYNWPQLDDPGVNAAMEKASATAEPEARAKAWAEVNKLITAQAPAVPYIWDTGALIQGTGIHGVAAIWNGNEWDLSYSFLDNPSGA